MKYSEARTGRVFILRLEDGEILHEIIEQFARKQGITAAMLIALGGADRGSKLIVGPEEGRTRQINPLEHALADVHELAGVGTIFPDEGSNPILHLHAACGRKDETVAGCVRAGVRIWKVAEVIIIELLNTNARRELDPETGFQLLQPE